MENNTDNKNKKPVGFLMTAELRQGLIDFFNQLPRMANRLLDAIEQMPQVMSSVNETQQNPMEPDLNENRGDSDETKES